MTVYLPPTLEAWGPARMRRGCPRSPCLQAPSACVVSPHGRAMSLGRTAQPTVLRLLFTLPTAHGLLIAPPTSATTPLPLAVPGSVTLWDLDSLAPVFKMKLSKRPISTAFYASNKIYLATDTEVRRLVHNMERAKQSESRLSSTWPQMRRYAGWQHNTHRDALVQPPSGRFLLSPPTAPSDGLEHPLMVNLS